jgi:Flp pilus assembly protein TadG
MSPITRARLPQRGSERGVSSLELVLYMPLLMMTIFLTVQFALLYLGNQVISSSARQAARVARSGFGAGGPAAQANALTQATEVATHYAASVGYGLVTDVSVQVDPVKNGTEIRVLVTGHALQLVPGVAAPTVSKTVQGPVESFRQDTP